jgi:hypothetical protein
VLWLRIVQPVLCSVENEVNRIQISAEIRI